MPPTWGDSRLEKMINQKFKIRSRDVEIRIRSVRFTPRGYILQELCRNPRILSQLREKVTISMHFGWKGHHLDAFWMKKLPFGGILGEKVAIWKHFGWKSGHLEAFWVKKWPVWVKKWLGLGKKVVKMVRQNVKVTFGGKKYWRGLTADAADLRRLEAGKND